MSNLVETVAIHPYAFAGIVLAVVVIMAYAAQLTIIVIRALRKRPK